MRAWKNSIISAALASALLLSGCGTEEISAVSLPQQESVSFPEQTTPESVSTEPTPPESTPAEQTTPESTPAEQTPPEDRPLPKPTEQQKARFSERLSEIFTDYAVTGMSVALFSDGEIIHTENLGLADVGDKIPCTDNTRYRAASVSKTVTAMIMMSLCEKGLLSLDEPLSDAVGIAFDAAGSGEKITLSHLLTHTSGIYDTSSYENYPNARLDINAILKNAHTGYAPGTVYCYSNFAAGALGAVAEKATGEFFHDYARDSFFAPLGMDASYAADLLSDRESAANIYEAGGTVYRVKTWRRTSDYYEKFGLGNSYYMAQGELIITASDLARLGIALAGDGTVDRKRVLSEGSVKEMNTARFCAPDFDMGLGVRIHDDIIDGRVICGHPGNALGAICGLYYDPADHTGVAILTNGCLPTKDENGFYSMLREVLTEAYECYFSITE